MNLRREKMPHLRSIKFSQKHIVVSILLISLLMRWVLIFQGGQYYFSDEQRYLTSREVVQYLFQGQLNEAISRLFTLPEHLGYKIVGIIPAFVEHFIGSSLVLPAIFFSLFSVLNLYLIFLLSQRISGETTEAIYALLISALSQSLFYYSRHLMPYDVAMAFGLLALYVGLPNRTAARFSLICGICCVSCFVTYNGYWTLVGLVMLVHVSRNSRSLAEITQRGFFLVVGFFLPLLGLMVLANQAGINLLTEYRNFAQTITQGYFDEGWALPFAYFWHAEHFLFVVLSLLVVFAVLRWKKHQTESIIIWGGSILFIYLCLVIPSFFLHKFVVYGRLARQLMPFLILLSATGLARISQSGSLGRKFALLIAGCLFVQAAWNFNIAYGVSYPKDFVRDVQAQYKDFVFSPKRFAFGAPLICENHGYGMQNAKYFLAAPEMTSPIPGTILVSVAHPVNFLPYQYEGYTPEQRQAIRSAQLYMTFFRIDPALAFESELMKIGIKNCFVN